MAQRGRPSKELPRDNRTQADLRKFAGKNQKTNFSFLKEVLPEKFGDKVFHLVTDDESHSNVSEKMYLGWEIVQITKEDAEKSPLLARFMLDKDGQKTNTSATIRVPVNIHNPNLGVYGVLMMKSKDAFEREERAALNAEVARTEAGLKGGGTQADTGADESAFYAPNVDAHGNKGFKVEGSDSLI